MASQRIGGFPRWVHGRVENQHLGFRLYVVEKPQKLQPARQSLACMASNPQQRNCRCEYKLWRPSTCMARIISITMEFTSSPVATPIRNIGGNHRCGGRFRQKAIDISNVFRQALGLPLITTYHDGGHHHHKQQEGTYRILPSTPQGFLPQTPSCRQSGRGEGIVLGRRSWFIKGAEEMLVEDAVFSFPCDVHAMGSLTL